MSGNKGKVTLVLQERDLRLLSELAVTRIADREQAKLLGGFRSTTRANARLLKLTRAGLLNRFFVGSVAAGRKAIYTLSAKGGALTNREYRRISRAHGRTLVGDLFVEHQGRINDIYIAVRYRALPSGIRYGKWYAFHQPLTQTAGLIPDGYFEVQTSSGTRAVFVEVDLGSESMRVWEGKIRAYLQLALSGEFTRLFGQSQFRVAVITTSPRRLGRIRATIAKQTDRIFWLSDFESINRSGLWLSVWRRPKDDQMVPLI